MTYKLSEGFPSAKVANAPKVSCRAGWVVKWEKQEGKLSYFTFLIPFLGLTGSLAVLSPVLWVSP